MQVSESVALLRALKELNKCPHEDRCPNKPQDSQRLPDPMAPAPQ